MAPRQLVLCICILSMCATLLAQSPPSDVEAAARRFSESYGAGDLEATMALWSPASPQRDAFRSRLAGILRVRCIEVRGVDVTRVRIDGDRAVADVTVHLAKWGKQSSFFQQQTELATLTFERGGGDAWLLTGWRRQEEALADALVAAQSCDERERLLAAQHHLVTPALNEILGRRAIQLINQEQIAAASTLARVMESIGAELSDAGCLARARGIDSIVFRKRKQWDLGESLRIGRESVALAAASGDPDILAGALVRTGRVERWTTPDLGRASYSRALDLYDDAEDASIVAMAAGGVAESYDQVNDHRAALHYALLARDLAVANGDRVAQLNAELNIAGAYNFNGDYALAIPHFERAVSLSHAANLKGSVPAEALFEIARCHLALGHEAEFFIALKRGMAEQGGATEETTALAYSLLADYHLKRGEVRRAAAEAEQAVALARTGFRNGVLDDARLHLAWVRLRQHRPGDALALVHQIGTGAERHALAGQAYRILGQRARAYGELEESVEYAEDHLADFDERQREIQFHNVMAPYLEWVDMLVEDGRLTEALGIAERAKGRALLHALRGGRAVARVMMTEEERKHEQGIVDRITALNSQELQSPAREPAVQTALTHARVELEEYRTILYAKYPRLKAQETSIGTVTRDQIAALLDHGSSAFLEFVIGPKRTHVFLIRRDGKSVSVRCRTIAVRQERLTRKVDGLVAALAAQDRLYAAPARELYQLLLAPFDAELHGIKTLCIIPDGALWQLPFESLMQPDGRFFIERTAVFYAPSITVYREMLRRDRSVRAPGAFLAFADPPLPPRGGRNNVSAVKLRDAEYAPLPDAAREVENIAALFRAEPTKVYVGADALESRAKAESPRYAVIHFATHGVLDDNDPMFSHLVLTTTPGDRSEDGLLETWEMMQLDLHANLAVLSACETARGTIRNGEGMIGMSWALSVAGTSSTIVTQWKIASSTTSRLMVDFYRQWLGARASAPFAKAEALRQARLHVLADPAHRHPFFWSAFVLIGSGS